MLASVGPYKFINAVCENRSLNRSAWFRVKASPLVNTCFKVFNCVSVALSFSRYSNNTLSIDGTKCITVTWYFSIVSAIICGLFSPPGCSIQTPAPCIAHHKSSQTDTSNEKVVFCKITSSPVSGYAFCIQASLFTNPLCCSKQPLGLPVDPEV